MTYVRNFIMNPHRHSNYKKPEKDLLTRNLYQLIRRFKSFFVCLAILASSTIVGCKKGEKTAPSSKVDVYVAGTVFNGTKTIATIWKNGNAVSLASPDSTSYANAIAVVNNDIYVAGNINSNAVYWKNGVVHRLGQFARGSNARAITVIDGKVLVVGNGNGLNDFYTVPLYWKDDVLQNLTIEPMYSINPTGITSDGINVFISASAFDERSDMKSELLYWENQTLYHLDSLSKYSNGADAVAVSNGDVFIAGSSLDTSNLSKYVNRAILWKNGVRTILDTNDEDSEPTAIAVSGSDVYVSGEINDRSAGYWKNGNLKILATGTGILPCVGNAIAISGNDVYVAGRSGAAVGYWKNDSFTTLASNGLGAGIAVISRIQ